MYQKATLLALLSAAMTASATPVLGSQVLNCPNSNGTLYLSGTDLFMVECYLDRQGSDVSTVFTNTLGACIDQCAQTSGCVDVSWNPGSPGACHLKNGIQDGVANNNVWGAKETFNPSLTQLSCPFSDQRIYVSKLPNGSLRAYQVQCNTNYPSNDFPSNPYDASTLEQCASICNANAGCKGVVLNGRNCNLKTSTANSASQNGVSALTCTFNC